MSSLEVVREHLVILPLIPVACGPYPKKTILHCTLMHWFTLSEDLSEDRLQEWLKTLIPGENGRKIAIRLGQTALFGPEVDILVHVVEQNPVLHQIHAKVFDFLTQYGCTLARADWIGEGYRPHVTMIPGHLLEVGTVYEVSHLALVRRVPGQMKEILHVVSW